MAVNLEDPTHSRNLRDFLLLYNILTEQCFDRCVKRFHSNKLSSSENDCAYQCTDRYVAFNQKLMFTFVEHQNKKNKALEEATLAAMSKSPLLQQGMGDNSSSTPGQKS